MSNVRVYINEGGHHGVVPVAGSKVFVGDTELQSVTALELVADIKGAWTLKLSVLVDPAKLFEVLPKTIATQKGAPP